jgi:UDP-N-acetylmuramate--alanine ligase
MQTALQSFAGIGRRMQSLGELSYAGNSIQFIDDYAHHPREIAASIDAIRQGWPEKRILLVFQPHRYSRTHDLFDDFVNVLLEADVLLLMEVYSAGEEAINNADSRALAQALRLRGKLDTLLIDGGSTLAESLKPIMQADDIVVTLGAGSIGRISHETFNQLSQGVST